MKNFDIKQFLTENKLTDTSKRLDEKIRKNDGVVATQLFRSKGADSREEYDNTRSWNDLDMIEIPSGTKGEVITTGLQGEVVIQWETGKVTTSMMDSEFEQSVRKR